MFIFSMTNEIFKLVYEVYIFLHIFGITYSRFHVAGKDGGEPVRTKSHRDENHNTLKQIRMQHSRYNFTYYQIN